MNSGQLIIEAIRELAEEPMPARRVELLQSLVDAGLEHQLTRDLREAIAVLRIAKLIEPRRRPTGSNSCNKNYRPPRSGRADIPAPKIGQPYTRGPKGA